jgi:hypothetical protein
VNIASILICLRNRLISGYGRDIQRVGAGNSRPDLYPALVRVAVTDDVHLLFCKLDDTDLLQFLDRLNNSCKDQQKNRKKTPSSRSIQDIVERRRRRAEEIRNILD